MRRVMSSACFTLGIVWATAGAFKLLFGVTLTLALLPPLGLERVAVVPSVAIGLVLFAVGALLEKGANPIAKVRPLNAATASHELLDVSEGAVVPPVLPGGASPGRAANDMLARESPM
jgi:hypothetical protein